MGSTLFLLLFSERMGYGISLTARETLTVGISTVSSRFIIFVGGLIFIVGAVITSFLVFLMTNQRKRDFGLIKASGCPNGLVFTYFLVELLILSSVGCLLGILFGFISDSAFTYFSGFHFSQKLPNLWFGLLVFVAYFILAITFGTKPLLDVARLSPIKAMSQIRYYGLTKTTAFKPKSRFAITLRIALRSLYRQQSAAIRVAFFLSLVFILLTVTLGGSIIANDTTRSWLVEATDRNTIAIGRTKMCDQYQLLLSGFIGAEANKDFQYLNQNLFIEEEVLQEISSIVEIEELDPRLIIQDQIQEIANFTIDPETLATIPIGDQRESISLIVGLNPEKVLDVRFVNGRFLNSEDEFCAIIGDSLSHELFSKPLVQSLRVQNSMFTIVGIRVDPINNGRVVYVNADSLQNLTGIEGFNIVLARMKITANRLASIKAIQDKIKEIDPELTVLDLKDKTEANLEHLASLWSSITILSITTLASAAFCLSGYLLLSFEEQRKEFGILRAIGVKPKTVISIMSIQSLLMLVSSWAAGTSIGIIMTLLILVTQPSVTISTIFISAGGIVAALIVMFTISLYLAIRFAKKPVLALMQ